jgi:hypothetical protein
MATVFQIYQHVENGGDGSVGVRNHPTYAEAQAADEAQPESWGESSVKTLTLKIMGGEIYYKRFNHVSNQYDWIKAEKVEEK